MKKWRLSIVLLWWVSLVWAHPMPNTLIALQLTSHRLAFDIKIPLSDVETAVFQINPASEGLRGVSMQAVMEQYFSKHLQIKGLDGRPWPVQLIGLDTMVASDPFMGNFKELHLNFRVTPPENADERQFLLYFDAIMHQIVTHQAILSIGQDWENGVHPSGNSAVKSLAIIQVDPTNGEVLPVAVNLEKGSLWKGLLAMFRLGMRHIAEGYDHLLFLFLLVLIAPLVVVHGHWDHAGGWRFGLWRLLKIVTSFTIGHSITLAICSLGWVQFSSRWVEVAIALSILISALHTLRPLFFQREIWVAGGFGLIHGMAFSNTLRSLALGKIQLLWSLLGFNLGIEAVQLGLIALIAPVLFWLSETRYYTYFRLGIGGLGVLISLYWISQRLYTQI
jgi:hypothetical protein